MRQPGSRLETGEIIREYIIAIERTSGAAYPRSVIIRRDSATQYRVQTTCRGITEADHGTWRSEEDAQVAARALITGRQKEGLNHPGEKGWAMDTCDCRGRPAKEAITLTLECLDCEGGVVTCWHCGKPEWWPNEQRRFALTAAETHRWERGHVRVVARGFGAGYEGQIVMEVGVE